MALRLSAFFFLVVLIACAAAQTMITTCQGLQDINLDLAGNYALANDIDCSDTVNWNGGEGFEPVGTSATPFTGSIDGKNYAITGLIIDRSSTNDVGLFGYASRSAQITSTALLGGNILGDRSVGSLVGQNEGGSITHVHTTGAVVGSNDVGGLVGSNSGTLSNSYSACSVVSSNKAGGLVGSNGGTLSTCYATGSVAGSAYVGGLVGSSGGILSNSYATGNVTSAQGYVGGLLGYNTGTLSTCYATGSVMGPSPVGGLVGSNSGSLINGYWDTQTSGQASSDGATGKITAEMYQQATFEGWDFDCIWAINEGNDYPKLTLANCRNRTLTVSTCAELQIAVTVSDASISLTQDIDCTETVNWNGGAGFLPGAGLSVAGSFNGNGYIISDLTINRRTTNGVGLFAIIAPSAQIIFVGLLDANVTGASYVGGLVGYNDGLIINSYVIGSMTGSSSVGGLVGDNRGGTLSNSYATVDVTGSNQVGGLVGSNGGTLINSYATGSVKGDQSFVGGLVGTSSSSGTLSNCYVTSSVTGSSYVGGLLGGNSGTLSNCYAIGSVMGSVHVGGLLGSNADFAVISNCYATGSVTGSNSIGGLVGSNAGTLSTCYATGSVTGSSGVGGLLGSNDGSVLGAYWDTQTSGQFTSAGGFGKTTAQMQQQLTFISWDFLTTWFISSGYTYPLLQSFVLPPTHPNAIANQSHPIGALYLFTVPADTFSDSNGLILTYSAQLAGSLPLPAWLFFTASTHTFVGTPLSGAQDVLTIEVTAHNTPSQFVKDTFTLHIINQAPVVQAPMVQQTALNQQFFQYIIPEATFFDADGDRLTLNAVSENFGPLPAWLSFNAGLGIFSGTPTQRGSAWINVTASDGFEGSVSGLVEIVTPNSAPQVVHPFPNQVVRLRQPFSFSVPISTFSDLDNDPLTYSANLFGGGDLLEWMSFDPQTLTFEGTPDVVGFVTLSVVATDIYNATAFVNFGLSVSDIAGNSAPVLAVKIPSQNGLTDEVFELTVSENTFEDPDGDPLIYTAIQEGGGSLPEWLTFSGETRTFYGVPDRPEILRLTVRADDGRSGYALDTFTLTIEDATNYPPVVLNPLSNQVASVGQAFQFTLPSDTFDDVNQDTLVISVSQAGNRALPGWLTFDAGTRTFKGKPDVWDTNTYADKQHTIEVRASDGTGSAVTTFYLFVEGESFWEVFIKAVAPIVGIVSTCITVYLKRATLWNYFCKRWYRLPRQVAVANTEYEWSITLPARSKGGKVAFVQAFKQDNPLPGKKILPDWLQYHPKQSSPSIAGTPSVEDCESLTLRLYGYDELILAEFELVIVATADEAAGLERAEVGKTARGWRNFLMTALASRHRDDREMLLIDDAE